MNHLNSKIFSSLNLGILGSLVVGIAGVKIFFLNNDSSLLNLIVNLLIVFTFILLSFYILKIIRGLDPTPLGLVVNIGFINAFIFIVIIISENFLELLFENFSARISTPGFIENLIYIIYAVIFFILASYLIVAFAELYFHKQNRSRKTYYVTMLTFFGLASISNFIFRDSEYDFIRNTFFIVSIILIALNSIRISWIAFISKKEKVSLLILSIIILTLFILNLINSGENQFNGKVLTNFSAAFYQLYFLLFLYGSIYFGVLFFTTLFHIPTAEAYDRKAKEVSSLQYFSKLINQVLDFEELADTITDITTSVSSADSAWIVLKEDGEVKVLANKNIALVDANLINQYLLNSGVCEKISETKLCNLDKFSGKSKLSEKFGSVAVSPLRSYNEIKGYLIAARKNELIFYEEDKNAINTFSDYASVAIENSKLLEQSIEKERLEKELDVAREIQKKIIPQKNPVVHNLAISSVFIPAFEVGGDYYDFFEISKTKLGFIIADVSGKGISAAFIMAEVKGIFESLSRIIESPKEILVKANQILKSTLDNKSFVSALYGIFDLSDETFVFSRAGHSPAILMRNSRLEIFKPTGIGLGLTSTDHFKLNLEEIKINLEDNDTLIFYTDGITEAKNKFMDDFGEERFAEILVENSNKSAEEISNRVIRDVTVFSQEHSQYDDITLVILKWIKN